MGDHRNVNLPPGFRFYPTDEELVVHFLQRKASLLPCHPDVIPDLDLYPYDPWDLHGKYAYVCVSNTLLFLLFHTYTHSIRKHAYIKNLRVGPSFKDLRGM